MLCCSCSCQDESPDSWVSERDMAEDVLSDWQQGLETAAVATLLDMKEFGTEREFLVQWADGTWVSSRGAKEGREGGQWLSGGGVKAASATEDELLRLGESDSWL